jgi:lactocepin
VLFNKEKTVLLKYPRGRKAVEYIVPDGVIKIAAKAFEYSLNLQKVTFSESLAEIKFNAFGGCTALESINMPSNIPALDRPGFEDTAWFASQSDGVVYIENVVFKYKGEMPKNFDLTFKEGTIRIMGNAFVNQKKIKSVTFPDSVQEIEEYAFSCCGKLEEVNFPKGEYTIAEKAFSSTIYPAVN